MSRLLTYLSPDSVSEGVGASQVLAYVERIAARGLPVRLHSFEPGRPGPELQERLRSAGVDWRPLPFGRPGPRGGLGRVLRGAQALRGAELVHARSDLAAASALLARSPRWVWDVRSLWADQRIALGALQAGGPEDRVLRRVEHAAARRSSAVVTLTEAVLPVLDARHGLAVSAKATVVPTCVDTSAFAVTPAPARPPLRLLLSGTLNGYYDVPLMLRLVEQVRALEPAELLVLTPGRTAWEDELASVEAVRRSARPGEVAGHVAASSAGLSVCRADAGVSLTAAVPTKIAEFLASGRPVVVSPGLGDTGRLATRYGCAVVLGPGRDAPAVAARELVALVADPQTPARCRAAAEELFDLDRGVDRLMGVYDSLAGARASRTGRTPERSPT